jgi:hypothetical protein
MEHWGPDDVVLIEDVKPYRMLISQAVIDTCKVIGMLVWRLESVGIKPQLPSRSDVKQWVFNTYPDVCIPKIEAKLFRKSFEACDMITREPIRVYKDGRPWKPRKAQHGSVDDRIVIAAMKVRWGIETPKKGKRNSLGIRDHAWQALALASYYMNQK